MKTDLENESLQIFNNIIKTGKLEDYEEQTLKRSSSTWTYMINDDPFNYRHHMFSF